MKKIFGKIYRHSYSALLSPFTKKVPKKIFTEVYNETRDLYLKNKDKYDYLDFLMPEWSKNMNDIENYFLNDFSFSFLNNQTIKKTMFVYTHTFWKNVQKKLISEQVSKKDASNALKEYNLGRPLLNDLTYISSGNNIHHFYHLIKFFKESGTQASEINTVVEVGGGYGNMAKIFKTLNKESTYIIIDIPIFSSIQAVYLKTLLGKDAVNLLGADEVTILKGKINLIPLNKKTLDRLAPLIDSPDLFMSTWALSESNKAMQDYIKNVNYFNARYLLLAFQKSSGMFSYAQDVQNVTKNYKEIFSAETEYLKDNYYLFCKKI